MSLNSLVDVTNFSGECVSSCSKESMTLNEVFFQNNTDTPSRAYGRKIDVLLHTRNRDRRVELCSNEWKRPGVSIDIARRQQAKNLRINSTILDKLNSINGNDALMAMDWLGKNFDAKAKRVDDTHLA